MIHILALTIFLVTTVVNRSFMQSYSFNSAFRVQKVEHFKLFPSDSDRHMFPRPLVDRERTELSQELILDDFDQILEAIQIYSDLYGIFSISSKFDVPDDSLWPSHLHGLRLGKRLEKILSNQKFFSEHAKEVAALQEIGFDPYAKSSSDDWPNIVSALKVYKQLYGNTRVPSKFVVPDDEIWPRLTRNMKLGNRISAIRSSGRYVRDRLDRQKELDDLGFEWRVRNVVQKHDDDHDYNDDDETIFNNIVQCLNLYKNLVDEQLRIDSDFVIPESEEWPKSLWRLNLGMEVQAILQQDKFIHGNAHRKKTVEDMGLIFEDNSRNAMSQRRFELIYTALSAYKSIYGDLQVPVGFVIPQSLPWPVSTHGLKLGLRVQAIRAHGAFISNIPERREKLDQLGFSWSNKEKSKKMSKLSSSNVDEEGKAYKINDDSSYLTLSKSFSMDYDASFDPMSSYSDEDQLDEEELSIFAAPDFRELASASLLDRYHDRDRSTVTQIRDFSHFEGGMTPYDLGRALTEPMEPNIRESMSILGYRFFEFDGYSWSEVIAALMAFKSTFGDLQVPPEFVITDETVKLFPKFSTVMVGLELGEVVKGLRTGDIDGFDDISRKKLLDAIGFEWIDLHLHLHFRFQPLVMGLRIFRHLNGFANPSENFVVPAQPQWPIWMVGMPLGEWVAVCRIQQNVLAEFYPDRKAILDALRFTWWIPPSGNILRKFEKIPSLCV